VFSELLRLPVTVVDDQAIPFALYAAGRLLAGQSPPDVESHAMQAGAAGNAVSIVLIALTTMRPLPALAQSAAPAGCARA
jgi:hypothetical protein